MIRVIRTIWNNYALDYHIIILKREEEIMTDEANEQQDKRGTSRRTSCSGKAEK